MVVIKLKLRWSSEASGWWLVYKHSLVLTSKLTHFLWRTWKIKILKKKQKKLLNICLVIGPILRTQLALRSITFPFPPQPSFPLLTVFFSVLLSKRCTDRNVWPRSTSVLRDTSKCQAEEADAEWTASPWDNSSTEREELCSSLNTNHATLSNSPKNLRFVWVLRNETTKLCCNLVTWWDPSLSHDRNQPNICSHTVSMCYTMSLSFHELLLV